MSKELIDEINGLKDLFLVKLIDNDEELHIYVCGATYSKSKRDDIEEMSGNNAALYNILEGSTKVEPDYSNIYDIFFSSCVGYSARNESYTSWDHEESFECGNRFRVYTKSKYLDFLKTSTFASQLIEYMHYGIITARQIIDVASSEQPKIVKYID